LEADKMSLVVSEKGL